MTNLVVPLLPVDPSPTDVSRRGFLRGAALAGGGLAVATLAACTPSTSTLPGWTYPATPTGVPAPTAAPATTIPGASHDHGASPAPGGSAAPDDHDANALAVVKRFLGGEAGTVEGAGNQPYGDPRVESGVKVFELTVDKIKHKIDALKDPIDALGFKGTWPGPRIDVVEEIGRAHV